MILYIENPKDATRKPLELISESGKVAAHKVNPQKSFAFLYILTVKIRKTNLVTSLVVYWIRICLPMQGAQVPSLVWEDSMCRGATKPVPRNY